jgi:hypothetical protein
MLDCGCVDDIIETEQRRATNTGAAEMTAPKLHLATESFTWMAGDVAIYLTPAGDTVPATGWDVTAIDMQGEVVESEFFADQAVARRYIHELAKDLS